MYHNSAKALYDLHQVASIKLAIGFISNPISFANHSNWNWSVRSSFLWEQDRKVNDSWSFILSGIRPGTPLEFWKPISVCLNPPLCRTLSKCFKSCSGLGCFHISVPRPFIEKGRMLYTRENLRYWLKDMAYLARSLPMLCNKQTKDEELLESKNSQIGYHLICSSKSERSYATNIFICMYVNR